MAKTSLERIKAYRERQRTKNKINPKKRNLKRVLHSGKENGEPQGRI